MITKAERELLMEDWFERNSDFTKGSKRKAARQMTEVRYPFLTKHNDMKIVFGKIYHMGKSMLNAMCFKQRYILKVSQNFKDSCTNGVEIMVSTDYFDDTDITLTEKLDIFLGITIHEGLHCKYTDFDSLAALHKSGLYNDSEWDVIKSFSNIIEDERIEWKCGEEMPGYVSYLSTMKKYIYETRFLKTFHLELKGMETTTENLLCMFINYVVRCVRYPTHMDPKHIDFLGEYLLKVKDILSVYPTSTKEVNTAAVKIYELVKDFIVEKQNEDGKPTNKSDVGKSMGSNEFKELMKKILEMTEIKVVSGTIQNAPTQAPKLGKSVNPYIFQELEGCVEIKPNQVLIHKTYADKDAYNEVYKTIRQYVPAVQQALTYNDKHQKIKHKSLFNGLLDTSKLVDSRAGVTNVYERKGLVETEKFAVCLLIDKSGSMGGNKILAAQKTAILLFEALRHNNSIELFIYGHTADNERGIDQSTSIYTYYEPRNRSQFNLGSIKALCCNRDGLAILETAKRVREQTKRKCLMFVISDGLPYANQYDGAPAIEDTRLKVKQVERTLNMDVVQIAIESENEPELMFSKFIKFTDINRLPIDLNKFIKQTLLRKQSVQIS
jgi:hypothetical protein